MQHEYKKFVPSSLFEGMTSLRALIAARNGENPQNDRKILRVYFASESKTRLEKELSWLRHRANELNFSILPISTEELTARTTGNTHGGIIAECSERTIPPLSAATLPSSGFYILLDGIEDPYNFGYALRSLYAMGVDGVLLPERNWMSAAGVVARASAGASELIPLYTAAASEAVSYFRFHNYRVIAADVRTQVELQRANLKKPLLLVVGGEKRGISRELLNKCDEIVKIPYGRAFPAALSAASASTILGYEVMRQNAE